MYVTQNSFGVAVNNKKKLQTQHLVKMLWPGLSWTKITRPI